MEIMKVHNSEVHFANLLAFFLRPKENHKLGNYFLSTLLKTNCHQILDKRESRPLIDLHPELYSNPENLKAKSIEVKVEVRTAKDNRIDILIVTPEFVICIEFKINHDLNNPLQDYCDYVNKTYPGKKHFFVILTPYKKAPVGPAGAYFKDQNEFRQILLGDFFDEIDKNLPTEFSEEKETEIYFNYYQELQQTVLNRKIRSHRHKMLHLLKFHFNEAYCCEFHNNISGGFLEIKLNDYRLKVRIKSTGRHFEKWSPKNRFESKIEILGSETTFQKITQTLQDVLRSQAVIQNTN